MKRFPIDHNKSTLECCKLWLCLRQCLLCLVDDVNLFFGLNLVHSYYIANFCMISLITMFRNTLGSKVIAASKYCQLFRLLFGARRTVFSATQWRLCRKRSDGAVGLHGVLSRRPADGRRHRNAPRRRTNCSCTPRGKLSTSLFLYLEWIVYSSELLYWSCVCSFWRNIMTITM